MKVTTKTLYEIQDAINNDNGVLRASVYFSDALGTPGTPQFYARDRHGVERCLVVWIDGWALDEVLRKEGYIVPEAEVASELLGEGTLAKLMRGKEAEENA